MYHTLKDLGTTYEEFKYIYKKMKEIIKNTKSSNELSENSEK